MTKILASDYNGVSKTLNLLYSTGSGTRGYGQTTLSLSTVSIGSKILASSWTNLANVLTVLGTHQGTSLAGLPTFTVGNKILATDLSTMQTLATAVDVNRLTANISGMT